jgi:hypothetical protein
MFIFTVLGLLLMASAAGIGVWYVIKNMTLKQTETPYDYVVAKNEDGVEIEKVIDRKDNA